MKIIEKKFYCDLYKVDISFLFNGDVEDLKKFMRKRHGDAKFYSGADEYRLYEEDNVTDGLQFHVFTPLGHADRFYVWKAMHDGGLLNHEIWHLTVDIMYVIGAKHVPESEECYAYLNGWIAEKINAKTKAKFPQVKK